MVQCMKCGGEMRDGRAFVPVTIPPFQPSSGFGVPGMGIPSLETTREEEVQWRERTDQKTGFFKRSEARVMKIAGLRCAKCDI